jgi:septal ring factor EnvC (AmiA/AmiB activator)
MIAALNVQTTNTKTVNVWYAATNVNIMKSKTATVWSANNTYMSLQIWIVNEIGVMTMNKSILIASLALLATCCAPQERGPFVQKVVYIQPDLEYQAVLEDRIQVEYAHFNAIFDELSKVQQATVTDLIENSESNRLLAVQLHEISYQLAESLDTIKELELQLKELELQLKDRRNNGRHREND